ncbi:MAG TPA: hypothetical protein VI911_11975 [Patescibacteria group bacterium]|nr:hypothetical protein [Patescibacteria group bacterium]
MSIFAGDLIVKTAIELAIEDMRKNPWLIEDIFSSLIENPFLKEKYGLAEINRAKEFILNNKIPVYLKGRIDKEEFPCITLSIGSSEEMDSLATLGDLSDEVVDLLPSNINKSIRFIVPPFNIVSYDKDNGIVEVPESIEEYRYIGAGMILVDPNTGEGFTVLDKAGTNGLQIAAGSDLKSSKMGIIPQYQLYRARRERIISKESYNIGCHAHGDPSSLIFLYSVVKYGLLRYRESLLERENFQLSSISCTDMVPNEAFGVENVFSRYIVLRGQTEESWIKGPKRIIEAVDLSENIGINEVVLDKGIKILSQDAPEEYSGDDQTWITIDDDEE